MPTSRGFYTATQVARLAKIPARTLYDWQARGIIVPSLQIEDAGKVIEGYSYADLTIARMIRALREKRIDFKSASLAFHHMYERLGPPSGGWSDSTVYFVGKQVFADLSDEWSVTTATLGGQRIETRLFGDFFEELRLSELRAGGSILVPVEFQDAVDIDPDVMGGEPVVRGTRVPTSLLFALNKRMSVGQIAKMYGSVTRRRIESAVAYERYLDTAA